MNQTLSSREVERLLKTLKERFQKNLSRHESVKWEGVLEKLRSSPEKMWSLFQMEKTGGEPDVVDYDAVTDIYTFFDCSEESPIGRRSLCYDREAFISIPRGTPKGNVVDVAEEMGIDILTHEEYRRLQEFGFRDTKTSSWIKTPNNVRKLGGAIFGDARYDEVFIYHNSAQTFYVSRGFRGALRV